MSESTTGGKAFAMSELPTILEGIFTLHAHMLLFVIFIYTHFFRLRSVGFQKIL